MTSAVKRLRLWGRVTPYLFILPWMIGFLVFTLGPLIFSLVMSFFDWPIVGSREFIAFDNYLTMFGEDPLFWKALRVTLRFMVLFVPLNLMVALGLAMLLAQDVRGMAIYRTCFFLPSVISGVALPLSGVGPLMDNLDCSIMVSQKLALKALTGLMTLLGPLSLW